MAYDDEWRSALNEQNETTRHNTLTDTHHTHPYGTNYSREEIKDLM